MKFEELDVWQRASLLASMIRLKKGYVKEIHQLYNIEEPRT